MLLAQINSYYAFTQSSTEWEAIYGTYCNEAMDDDGLSYALPLGFTFPYGANQYTEVKVSSNGWLGLGTGLTSAYYANDLATLNIRPLVAPLWDDLDLSFGAVMYATYGEAPHRVFFMQWLAARWNWTATNEYNFIVRLHETGQVDFIYGPHIGTPVNASASIGMNMEPGGLGYYFSILPGNPAQAFTNSQYQNLQTPLASGIMYIFMPRTIQAVNAAAVNLAGPKNPMQNVASDYTVTIGNAGTTQIPQNAGMVYLKRGEDVLASAEFGDIMPSAFSNVALSWAPDTTGLMYLTAEVVLSDDADSLNNSTFGYSISVQPYVGNDDEISPSQYLSLDCYPNPFRENVSINYSLSKSSTARLEIYNLKGQLVRQLVNGNKSAGNFTVQWDGTDHYGNKLASGVYLCRLESGNATAGRKLIIIR